MAKFRNAFLQLLNVKTKMKKFKVDAMVSKGGSTDKSFQLEDKKQKAEIKGQLNIRTYGNTSHVS